MSCHKIFPSSLLNPGDRTRIAKEEWIPQIDYQIHKITNRRRPSKKNIVIFPIFPEFGSEVMIPLLCIPKLMANQCSGKYTIVVGWHGRKYLYQHLVDEFWELDEKHLSLREYCRCFHHDSKNLKLLEEKLKEFGSVVGINDIASCVIYPQVQECPVIVNNFACKGQMMATAKHQTCIKCGVSFPPIGEFFNMTRAKKNIRPIPQPAQAKIDWAKSVIPPNAVAIVGRARKCYGRNLGADFYQRLIRLVQDLGYNPVWMGEKSVSLSCPCKDIFDFTNLPESKDLESTLALVKQMKFTIQFWTASTRLASLVGTPFLLFESPDQIWGVGHEGYRLNVCTKGKFKIVVSHFLNVLQDQTTALHILKDAIYEMEDNNYRVKIGQVNCESAVRENILNHNLRVGFTNF